MRSSQPSNQSPTAKERDMPTEILMPALSPTMEEGTLAKWLVKEGDTVRLATYGRDRNRQSHDGIRSRRRRVDRQDPDRRRHRRREGEHAIAVLLEDGESADDIGSAPAAAAAPARQHPTMRRAPSSCASAPAPRHQCQQTERASLRTPCPSHRSRQRA